MQSFKSYLAGYMCVYKPTCVVRLQGRLAQLHHHDPRQPLFVRLHVRRAVITHHVPVTEVPRLGITCYTFFIKG